MIIPDTFAAIDLGSNTFHLVIFRDGGEAPFVVLKQREAVGIGKKGIEKKVIVDEALERGITALLKFKKLIEEHRCKKVHLMATSAFRSANNKIEVLKTIKNRTGFDVHVIDGEEEAGLIYEGVKRSVKMDSRTGLIMDIGGGSVEFILCNQDKLLWKESFEIGGLRLMERFHTEDPISETNKQELSNHLDSALHSLFMACLQFKPQYLIGASGTFDTLREIRLLINPIDDKDISLEDFNSISKSIETKTYEERLEMEGLIPLRAEMIVVACLLVDKVIEKCDLKYISCSDYALKEGLMFKMIEEKTVL